MAAECIPSARNPQEKIERERNREARRETKIKWRKELEKSYLRQASGGVFMTWPVSGCMYTWKHVSAETYFMYVLVFIAVCLRVSVSLDDLWFVFTLPYFRPACRHRRMNDKLRMSIGFTPAPVVPCCPAAQWQESSRDEYIKNTSIEIRILDAQQSTFYLKICIQGWPLTFH